MQVNGSPSIQRWPELVREDVLDHLAKSDAVSPAPAAPAVANDPAPTGTSVSPPSIPVLRDGTAMKARAFSSPARMLETIRLHGADGPHDPSQLSGERRWLEMARESPAQPDASSWRVDRGRRWQGYAPSSAAAVPWSPMGAAAGQGDQLRMMMGVLSNLMGGDAPFIGAPPRGGGAGGRRPIYANGGLDGSGGLDAVMSDGALTVEDKVTLMLMMIMKKMDQDILAQGNRINALQQQQGGGAAGGGGRNEMGISGSGDATGGQAGAGAPSIDVETMKLKRLIDKRSQMFDMLRQIVDKYNETAKNVSQSIGR